VLAAVAARDLPVHPAARDAYAVWLAAPVADFAPAQTAAAVRRFVTVARHGGEPMLIGGFRAYAAARAARAGLRAAVLEANGDTISAIAWDEVAAVVGHVSASESERADLADRLVRMAPDAMRADFRLDRGAPLQAADSRLGVPVRARRAFEARRLPRTVIAEALARLGAEG
jgi:hypothetical protein